MAEEQAPEDTAYLAKWERLLFTHPDVLPEDRSTLLGMIAEFQRDRHRREETDAMREREEPQTEPPAEPVVELTYEPEWDDGYASHPDMSENDRRILRRIQEDHARKLRRKQGRE